MKNKLIDALKDTPFAILLAVVSAMSIWAGLLMIAVYVVNKALDYPTVTWVNGRKRKNVN